MKALIGFLIVLSTTPAFGSDLDKVLADIKVLTEQQNVEAYRPVAKSLLKYTKVHNMDYRVVLALFMTESSMQQNAVSATGDLGIGQINYEIWQEEFLRLKKAPLDKVKLKKDTDYAIKRTVEILSILKNAKDKQWVAKYHSKTPSLKKAYYQRINKQLVKLATADKTKKIKPLVLQVAFKEMRVATNP
jgi:hypothetical protein